MTTGKTPGEIADTTKIGVQGNESTPPAITVMSFGYKEGPVPLANVVFDVRFLKNPYWVPELRPLTGMDISVREYVMDQDSARQFLEHLIVLLKNIVPRFNKGKIDNFTIAFGCTGGQHRSVSLAEALAGCLHEIVRDCEIIVQHRELVCQRTVSDSLERTV